MTTAQARQGDGTGGDRAEKADGAVYERVAHESFPSWPSHRRLLR